MDGRTAWLWFAASFSSLIVGLTMVLAFMLRLVVPSLEARALHRTQCLVHSISLPCTSPGQCLREGQGQQQTGGSDCVKVQVLYRLPGRRTTERGYLFQAHLRHQDVLSNRSQPDDMVTLCE